MQNVLMPRHAPATLAAGVHAVSGVSSSFPDAPVAVAHSDDQFMAMLAAYRTGGGLARAPEVFALFKRCSGADVGTLAGWIVNRKVICFDWQSRMWLPLFQFNRLDMMPQAGLRRVLEALTQRFSPWALAQWFAQPNPWLADQSPCDALGQDPPAVLRAACAEVPPLTH
ncbi:MAG: hypothetical protein IPO43_19035 [Rhodoferax sp.]|nr:hypothetical protein [Rhodoferax sp.]